MKLTKRVVSLILTICFLITAICFFGISNAGLSVKSANDSNSLVYLQKFEKFEEMFNCGFVNFYGKVDLAEEHALTGTAAKIRIDNVRAYSSNPCMHIDLNSKVYGYDYSDFSMVDFVGFYFYNPNDFVCTLRFVITDINGGFIINNFYHVQPESGINVRERIDRVQMKINSITAKEIRLSVNGEDGTSWIFDDVYIEKAIDKINIESRTFDTDNILDFNDYSDINYIVKDSVVASTVHDVTCKLARDSGIVKDGNALKVDFVRSLEPDGDYTIQPAYYYSGVALSSVFYENFNFKQLWTKNFCFDIFSVTNKPMKFIIRITDGAGAVLSKEYVVKPNEWQTLSINFSEAGEDVNFRDEHISKLSIYVNYQEMDGDILSFYIDNMRLVGGIA